jgi:Transposase DDE domain
MIIFSDSARSLKRYLKDTCANDYAQFMMMLMVLGFILRRGRMSCLHAAGVVASEAVHRGELTRFLARPRWQQTDFNEPLRKRLLMLETRRGKFLFIIDGTLVSQCGKKTENTYSTGNRLRRPRKGRRYNKKKIARKTCHNFTFGLLITPSGYRIPFQIPHYTEAYCKEYGVEHRTTAEAAADLVRSLPLAPEAEVVVLGDTAYDAKVIRDACQERGYIWIVPVNVNRVYEGPRGNRPQVRSRLKDWTSLSLQKFRLQATTGEYADYRRLSRYRVGPKQKPREYYAYQETCEVHSVGRVRLVFSTTKKDLKKATCEEVKILMTNASGFSLREIIELYSLRWQIELFFKELKSTLGFAQYSFQKFSAVRAWVELAITTVLFLEQTRAERLADRRLSKDERRFWRAQRLHGLCETYRHECQKAETKFLAQRLKTSGGLKKVQQLLHAAMPVEYRACA